MLKLLGLKLRLVFNLGRTRLHGLTLDTTPFRTPRLVREGLLSGAYEAFEAALIQKFVKRGDTVLEIGAAIGLISMLAQRQAGPGNVHSYEANPAVGPLLQRNHALNGMTPNVTMKAVTADGRDLTFHADRRIVSSSIIDRKLKRSSTISVESVRFADLLQAHAPNVLIMDVEGAEEELLIGTPLAGVELLIVELHPHIIGRDRVDRIIEELRGQGFAEIERQEITWAFRREVP